MHALAVPIHIWLAALVIVMPVPEPWIKTAICLIFVLVLALGL